MRSEQELLSGIALTVFKLNGQLLAAAEEMARGSGLTAAWWQVLGAVLRDDRAQRSDGRDQRPRVIPHRQFTVPFEVRRCAPARPTAGRIRRPA